MRHAERRGALAWQPAGRWVHGEVGAHEQERRLGGAAGPPGEPRRVRQPSQWPCVSQKGVLGGVEVVTVLTVVRTVANT